MPVPEFLAKSNRFVLNPITRRFAGNIPPFALLLHHGRTSGKEYRTPIMAFPTRGVFVIALTYGRGTDWEQNVRHEGRCVLIYRRERHELTHPRLIEEEEADTSLPWVIRHVLPILGVHDFLRLDKAG